MMSIKEKQRLVRWARAMNETIDPEIIAEVNHYEQLQKTVTESVRSNVQNDLAKLITETKRSPENTIPLEHAKKADPVKEVITEDTVLPVKDLVTQAVDHITKEIKTEEKTSYQQPDAPIIQRSLDDVRKKLKHLEDWLSKISLTGPGGGAGDIINLDMPTTVVTGDYTVTRRDYYVGVNCETVANIVLPTVVTNGRSVIIKDESGHAKLTPIRVIGNIDNDPEGIEIAINNGSVILIYRNGWRIV